MYLYNTMNVNIICNDQTIRGFLSKNLSVLHNIDIFYVNQFGTIIQAYFHISLNLGLLRVTANIFDVVYNDMSANHDNFMRKTKLLRTYLRPSGC